MPAPFAYCLFGLTLSSALELPELVPVDPAGDPDVRITIAPVALPPGSGFEPYAIAGGIGFAIDDVARYGVIGGDTIIVDAQADAPLRNVRLFLLGSAFGMLVQQRGILPLHANAIEIEGRAFAFLGPSGAGKSTLAAWMHDRGHRAMADDVCAVSLDASGRAVVYPGLPRLRLWKDALERSGRAVTEFERSYASGDRDEKFDVPLAFPPVTVSANPVPLGALYLLDEGPVGTIRALGGVEAFDLVLSNIYRGAYLSMTDRQSRYWAVCTELARSVPVFAAIRRWGVESFEEEAGSLLAHAIGLARGDATPA